MACRGLRIDHAHLIGRMIGYNGLYRSRVLPAHITNMPKYLATRHSGEILSPKKVSRSCSIGIATPF